jgi:hypothetical protein
MLQVTDELDHIMLHFCTTHGRWFSPGTPASSTTKTGHHDIAEILLKVALKHQKSIKINLVQNKGEQTRQYYYASIKVNNFIIVLQ